MMHNIHLVGVNPHADRFNIRSSLAVIGLFGVILIISYFNELARAGLLSRDKYANRILFQSHVRRTTEHNDVILKKDGDVHRLGLNLRPLHAISKGNASNHDRFNGEEINIRVHIGKNSSYALQNASVPVRIYQHQNTLSNIFVRLGDLRKDIRKNESLLSYAQSVSEERKKTSPFNSTMVLLYQHEPGGYAMRDCLIRAAYAKKLRINKVPLNAVYRSEWEKLPTEQKNSFHVLFGGLSFGACEGIQHPCSYSIFASHPIDRILQVYATCKKNSSKPMCHANHIDMTNTTIEEFARQEGNNLFQKLLYYSRHCKLVGDDELCIHDKKAFFLLNAKEKAAYLANVLENLPRWFRTVGLVQHWRQSIEMIDFTYGLNFSHCFGKTYRDMLPTPSHANKKLFRRTRDFYSFVQSKLMIDGNPYQEVREKLLNNTELRKSLHPDLSIYKKLETLFDEQVVVYRETKGLPTPSFSPTPEKNTIARRPALHGSNPRTNKLNEKLTFGMDNNTNTPMIDFRRGSKNNQTKNVKHRGKHKSHKT